MSSLEHPEPGPHPRTGGEPAEADENVCPDCGGTGVRSGETCVTCDGTGRISEGAGGD
jgi:DnaJ-class molecular chaperone